MSSYEYGFFHFSKTKHILQNSTARYYSNMYVYIWMYIKKVSLHNARYNLFPWHNFNTTFLIISHSFRCINTHVSLCLFAANKNYNHKCNNNNNFIVVTYIATPWFYYPFYVGSLSFTQQPKLSWWKNPHGSVNLSNECSYKREQKRITTYANIWIQNCLIETVKLCSIQNFNSCKIERKKTKNVFCDDFSNMVVWFRFYKRIDYTT